MRALPEGETLLQNAWGRVSREAKLAFFGAFGAGLLIHLYMLVNKLPNHDDILGLFIANDSTFSGRWFLSVPSAISSSLSIPWITGLLALLWLSLAAVCTVRMLRIRKPSLILLTSAVMASFPSVYYTLCYLFTADAYLFALLLAALGAYLSDRYRVGFLAGGVCIGLSLATYQAYVFFAVSLFAISMLRYLLFDPAAGWKSALSKLARYAAALALGALVYRVGLSLSLAIKDISLKTYMGLDSAGSVSVKDALSRIPLAYGQMLALCKGNTELLPGRAFGATLTFALAAAALLALVAIVRMRGPQRAFRAACALLILGLLPLCVNGILLVSTMGLHPLMQYPVCLIYALAVVLYDGLAAARKAEDAPTTRATPVFGYARMLLGYALALSMAGNVFLWAVDANQTYLALELKFDNMMSLATRMVDRVEQTPEYVPDETPVWYTGTLSDANYGAVKSEAFARASATDMTGREWNYTTLMNNLYFSAFVNHYIGVTFVVPEDETAYAAMETDAYKAMPYFPYPGSVKMIDGIIIINGGPNPQAPP